MKTSPITTLRRLLYGAVLVGLSGLNLTAKAQTECTEDIVEYTDEIITACSGANVSYKLSNPILYKINGTGWGLSKVYHNGQEIQVLNSSGTDFNSIEGEPGKFKTFKFIFAHSDGRTCYIQRDIEVISPATLTLSDNNDREGCEGVLTKVYPLASGDFDHITWTPSASITETKPPFTLPGVGEHTIKATVTKDGCQGEKEASLTYKVLGKPQLSITENNQPYAFSDVVACMSCRNLDLPYDTAELNKSLHGNLPFEFIESKIVWSNNPNPGTKLSANTTFKGTYTAKVQSTNNCGTSTPVTITRPLTRQFVVKDCKPTILPSSPPCTGTDYLILVSMTDGKIGAPTIDPIPGYTPKTTTSPNGQKTEIIIPGVTGQFTYKVKVPYQITCPSTSNPFQNPNGNADMPTVSDSRTITIKEAKGCYFTSSYEYCVGGKAVYTISSNNTNISIVPSGQNGVDLKTQKSLFDEITTDNPNQKRQFISKADIGVANLSEHQNISSEINFSISGAGGNKFTENLPLNARTDCGASLSVEYMPVYDKGNPTTVNYACAGDTILLTVSKNSQPITLVGMDIPFGAHTSGDLTPIKTETNGDYTALTYRFISYHCYTKNVTTDVDSVMPFVVRYKFNGQEESATLRETIKVRTCPPDPPRFAGGKILTQRNLEIIATNQTTYNGDSARLKSYWTFTPASIASQPVYKIDANKKTANAQYRVYPFSTTVAQVRVEFNEGDSIRFVEFSGTLPVTGSAAPAIVPNPPKACIGEVVEFTIDTAGWKEYVKPPKLSHIDSITLVWPDHPEIKFKSRNGSKVTFITNNAQPGTYQDYLCELHIYINDPISKTYTFDTILVYPLYPPTTFFVRGLSDVFRADTLHVCQGLWLEFDSLVKDPDIVDYYTLNRDPNYQYYNGEVKDADAADAGPVKAYANLGCANDPVEQTAYLVVDEPIASGDRIAYDGALCLGNTIELSLNSNGLITWIRKEDGKPDDTLCHNCLTGKKIPVLLNKPTIKVVAQQFNSCQDQPIEATFNKPINPYPDITMTTDTGACPYVSLDLKAKINGNAANTEGRYELFNLRTGQRITQPSLTAVGADLTDADGLKNYAFKPQDSLLLCYHSISHNECPRSDSARLVAFPSPILEVTANGDPQTDGGIYCLPKGTKKLTLRASGANDYTWLIDPQALGRSLVLEDLKQDSLLRVKGVENRHGCVDTFALKCVISVGQKSPTAAICPGDDVGACFEADSLPGTTYVWSGPNGFSRNETEQSKGFQICGITQSGTYTLTASRNGCGADKPYTYTLSYHPVPSLTANSSTQQCINQPLEIEFSGGDVPTTEWDLTQTILTHNGVTIPANRYDVKTNSLTYSKPNVQLSDTGTYILNVTTLKSCSAEASVHIKVDTVVPVKIMTSAPLGRFCEGEQSLLTADIAQIGNQSYIYRWFTKDPSGVEQPFANTESTQNITWTRELNNTYIYVRVKPNSCSSTDSIKATVIALPVLGNMPKDTAICTGMPFYLDPTADATPEVVIWYFMDENGSVDMLQRGAALPYHIEEVDQVHAGRYFFTVLNAGCIATSDTTRLSVYPLPVVGFEDGCPTFICSGSTATLTAVADKDGDGGTYLWTHSGEQTAQVVINQAGTYTVRYTSVHGCVSKDTTISIEGRETPYFQLPGDTSICRGMSFVIVGPVVGEDGLDNVVWHDGVEDPNRTAEEAGWYILTGYKNGCSFTDSLFVNLTFCGQFHIPSAFTPNGNQINDKWGAISAAKDEDMAEYDLVVFDHDGRVLFHGKKISEHWDGRYKGQLCPPGVYPYTFRALEKFEGIRYQASGTVTIVQ